MQKYFLIFIGFIIAMVFLPGEAKAQWTNPYETYRTNDLIRRMPKKKTVQKSTKKSSHSQQGKASRKAVRRKTRRVSQHLNFINPRFTFAMNSSRRISMVL